ncbi:1-acyl-sn-glycerol-3-phosphate acyltransferase [Caldimonas thermodepolymerans]|jgi:1-acyl-sn-glycerol-3-phosphate acyltransferase|uniref:1-acyl-sn-glycerol-3-phosphate acyltransferase n=1 Tax=Caldimonas thermodepolymerans TaxID=215580 RepID=A0A2S5T3U6_9BURK|nr:lysophospholipid acyltransferase family protein [Caldimonas thermodepolymerans]PPE69568.1 1-acyl-sn-glycerol-3-phosphate acyltransferase [Caldimonas thermodepolymerans]QPC30919.1 1-acyl-sn-glycerol-3-phosphate acyltransferase [Caldimonas thermodepolymerans]RDH97074.1 lyso-ornithine lipid acyltransferase [Caldimonas thermodepolymerans]UZG43659.1 1-acyl-sn-glycerol-3-phosphate acyltransferase [Caldimonas thermodepolymerans]
MLRAGVRLVRLGLHVLHGLAVVLLQFGHLDAEGRRARVQWWSRKLLRTIDAELVVEGTPRPGAKLFVANHVSWLDIVAINAVAPARFVSKAEVRHWPLLNRMVSAADTLYIERERRRDAMRVVHQMAEALEAGDTVAVFPEGTTSDGTGLLPFHANLLQAAIATGVPVQPVALRYRDAQHAVSPAAAYVGDTSLVASLWNVLRARGLAVQVCFLPAEGTRHADRRALARLLSDRIAERLAALG